MLPSNLVTPFGLINDSLAKIERRSTPNAEFVPRVTSDEGVPGQKPPHSHSVLPLISDIFLQQPGFIIMMQQLYEWVVLAYDHVYFVSDLTLVHG